MSSDVARAREFYSAVFGWTAEEPNPDFGGYTNFCRSGENIAGLMSKQMADHPDVWAIYIAVDDATKTVEQAQANGAHVIVEPMAVGDLGTMAVVLDPAGAAIGMWQPGAHRGFGSTEEAGSPSWFELHTNQYVGARDFYSATFGWAIEEVSATDDLRYSVATGEQQIIGIMDSVGHHELPPSWSVYWHTNDCAATLDIVVANGGAVMMAAETTPYGILAVATDPMGANFSLRTPPSN